MTKELKTHSKLSASGTHKWFNCPGSVNLCAQVPAKPDTAYSLEGTNAHSLMEHVLDNPPANAYFYIGKEKQHGLNFKVTEDMAGHVQEFVDEVRQLLNSLEGAELYVEKKFHLKHIHPDLYGTSDVVIVQPFGEIHVIDFKYGAGVPVDVTENTQLLYYALGAVHGEDYSKVVLHIHQPRAEHKDGTWRRWEAKPDYMVEFSKLLKQKALETQPKTAPLNEGEWCRWCNAAAVCPKLYKKAIEVARADFADASPKLPDVTKLTDEQLAKVIEHKKLVTNWIDAVEEHALNRMVMGEKITGLKLVKGKSRREWTDEESVQKHFGEKVMVKKMLTVAQAEKVLGKESIVEFVEKIEGNMQLAHEGDKRKEIANAKDDFTTELSSEDF